MPVLALWSAPRARSTVFFRSMIERGDLIGLHEPFCNLTCFGETDVDGRTFDSAASLLAWLRDETKAFGVFVKDTTDYRHRDVLVDRRFLAEARHAFLIRRPEEIAASFYALHPVVGRAALDGSLRDDDPADPGTPGRGTHEFDRHSGADAFPEDVDDCVRDSGDEAGDDLVGVGSAKRCFLDAEHNARRGCSCRHATDAPSVGWQADQLHDRDVFGPIAVDGGDRVGQFLDQHCLAAGQVGFQHADAEVGH